MPRGTASPEARARRVTLRAGIAEIDDAYDAREVLRRDVHVHREIYRLSGNPHLEHILAGPRRRRHPDGAWFLHRLPDVASHVREHVALLEAIVAGDDDPCSAHAGLRDQFRKGYQGFA